MTFELLDEIACFQAGSDCDIAKAQRVVQNGLQLMAVRSLPIRVLFDLTGLARVTPGNDVTAFARSLVKFLKDESASARTVCVAADDRQFALARAIVLEAEATGMPSTYFRNRNKALEWLHEERPVSCPGSATGRAG